MTPTACQAMFCANANTAHRIAVVLEHNVAGAVAVDEAGRVNGAALACRADERMRSSRGERSCKGQEAQALQHISTG